MSFLSLLMKPKVLVSLLAIIVVLALTATTLYYKQKSEVLKNEVSKLKQEVYTLRTQKEQVEKSYKALEKMVEDLKQVEREYNTIQEKIEKLKKECPKVTPILKPKPKVVKKIETKVETKSETKVETKSETKTETKTEDVKEEKRESKKEEVKTEETKEEEVYYEWGGEEFEKEAISVYNTIVEWFNSDKLYKTDSLPTNTTDSVSEARQASTEEVG